MGKIEEGFRRRKVKVKEGLRGGVTSTKVPLESYMETYYSRNFQRSIKRYLNEVTMH